MHIYIFTNVSKLRWHRPLKTFLKEDRGQFVTHIQYHGLRLDTINFISSRAQAKNNISWYSYYPDSSDNCSGNKI